MSRTLFLVAFLLAVVSCTPRESAGRKTAAEGTVPAVESLPAAERGSPVSPHGAAVVEPATGGPNPLGGTSWQWLYTQTPTEKVSVPDPSRYVVNFTADGLISGTADCNRMKGAYAADGKQIKIKGLATTRKMCPPGSLGDKFANDLWFVASYVLVSPDTLRMDMAADGGTFTFRRVK